MGVPTRSTSSGDGGDGIGGDLASLVSPLCGLFSASRPIETPPSRGRATFRSVLANYPRGGDF
jgi:hypothetical protein